MKTATTNLDTYTFSGCLNLKTLWLSDSVKTFGRDVFYLCGAFDTLYYAGTELSLQMIKGGTLLTKTNITYITEDHLAQKEDRDLASREPQKPNVSLSIASKTYDGQPVPYQLTTNSDGEVTFKWMRSSVIIDGAPTEVGRYYLVVKITGTENYQPYIGHYSFFIREAKTQVNITSGSLDKVYDGKPVSNPTFTTNSPMTPTVTWKSGDAICASAPTLPGVYTVVISVPADGNFAAASAVMTVKITDEKGVCWDGTAASAFAGGDGTEQNPYQIANAKQLAYLASLINNTSTTAAYASAHYRLTADLFLNNGASSYAAWVTTPAGQRWAPIGKDSTCAFKGTLDGCGYTIYGMYTDSNTYSGLFGYLDGATVKNLCISASTAISAGGTSSYTGCVAAFAVDSAFHSVQVIDSIVYAKYEGGGIVGGVKCINDHTYFEDCVVDARIYHTAGSVRELGGYIGRTLASNRDKGVYFTDCVMRGEVSTGSSAAGFIANLAVNMPVTFTNCVNYASVTVKTGGAAGFINNPASTINAGVIKVINCINYGTITSGSGTVGGFFATLGMNQATVHVENSANYGTVSVTDAAGYAGGIVGKVNGEPLENSSVYLKNVVCVGTVESPMYYGAIIGGTASAHSPLVLDGVYYPDDAVAVSIGVLNGAASVNSTAPILVEWLNAKVAENSTYLRWQMGVAGPKFVSALRMDSTDLDRYTDGTPLQNPLYTVLVGDGAVTVTWYKDGVALAGAPSAAGDYVVVVSMAETDAFVGSSVKLDVTLTATGESTLRINDPSKVYDGTPISGPVINTTNEGATVTYTYYKGVYGSGTLLAGAPTDAGVYYVVVSVGAAGEYAAIEKYKAFEIKIAQGQFTSVNMEDREYSGTPAAITGYTYNGTTTVSVTYYKGTYLHRIERLDGAPVEVGRYVVILNAAPEANYSGAEAYCEFAILPISTSVTLSGSLTKEYDGNPVSAPAYTATESGGTVTITWKDAKGNVLAAAPSARGSYSVTVSLAANGNYAGTSVTEYFEIWQSGHVWSGDASASFAGGTGLESSPFLIATPEQLAYLSQLVNCAARYSLSGTVVVEGNDYAYASAHYKLTADLKMNENSASYKSWVTFAPKAADWVINAPANSFTPIGKSSTYRFAGAFDGNGHTISGLFVHLSADVGLFGHIKEGTVKNLTVKESVFAGPSKNYSTGSVASIIYQGTFEDLTVKDVSVFGDGYTGGISAVAGKGTAGLYNYFTRVTFDGTVASSGNHAGGFFGRMDVHSAIAEIKECSVRGSVYANANAAGFVASVGTNPRIIIWDSVNHASVTSATATAAGFVCNVFYTTAGIYVTQIKNVVNYGTVTGATYAGGILGTRTLNGTSTAGSVTIANVLNCGAVSTTGANAIAAGGIIGYAAATNGIKLYNCVSAKMPTGVGAGSVVGMLGGEEDKLTATQNFGYGNVIGSTPAFEIGDGKLTELTEAQLSGTASIAENTTLTQALNSAATEENGYKTWSVKDGVLTLAIQ